MYEVFLLRANRTVFIATCDERFAMDCTVTLYIDRVLEKRFGGPRKSSFFCKQESGNHEQRYSVLPSAV